MCQATAVCSCNATKNSSFPVCKLVNFTCFWSDAGADPQRSNSQISILPRCPGSWTFVLLARHTHQQEPASQTQPASCSCAADLPLGGCLASAWLAQQHSAPCRPRQQQAASSSSSTNSGRSRCWTIEAAAAGAAVAALAAAAVQAAPVRLGHSPLL